VSGPTVSLRLAELLVGLSRVADIGTSQSTSCARRDGRIVEPWTSSTGSACSSSSARSPPRAGAT
jgi:hypothetical protein